VLLLAAAIIITIMWNWNRWEGSRSEQVTDDAYVRGDLTPLSTKVAGLVRDVKVSDFQQVHREDVLVELRDDDYQAQVAQASAAVEAAKAAIENNRRQIQLQDSRIERAGAGIDQPNAQRHRPGKKRPKRMSYGRRQNVAGKRRSFRHISPLLSRRSSRPSLTNSGSRPSLRAERLIWSKRKLCCVDAVEQHKHLDNPKASGSARPHGKRDLPPRAVVGVWLLAFSATR
jgi:hypothetical protein